MPATFILIYRIFFTQKITDITKSPYIHSSLTLESYEAESKTSTAYVTGTISTKKQRDLGIYIIIRFYDKKGALIKEGFDSSDKLNAGDKWKFSILVPTDAKKYEIKEISIVVPN